MCFVGDPERETDGLGMNSPTPIIPFSLLTNECFGFVTSLSDGLPRPTISNAYISDPRNVRGRRKRGVEREREREGQRKEIQTTGQRTEGRSVVAQHLHYTACSQPWTHRGGAMPCGSSPGGRGGSPSWSLSWSLSWLALNELLRWLQIKAEGCPISLHKFISFNNISNMLRYV